MSDPDDPQIMSFLAVRRMLGLLGLTLPILLYVAARVFGWVEMQPSISAFYHTPMGDLVVGILVAIGVFLYAYRGYEPDRGELISDRRVSRACGIGALGTALLPARPDGWDCAGGDFQYGIGVHWCWPGEWHLYFAALFFAAMAVFCFWLFPRGDKTADGTPDWRAPKNRIYMICGCLLLASIGMLVIKTVFGGGWFDSVNWVFWWEAVGIIAFAVAWLTKGKVLDVVR